MKNILKNLAFAIGVSALLISCEKNNPILFTQSDSFVAFISKTASVKEPKTINIVVQVSTLSTTPVEVSFDFSTEGITNPAVEGQAFTLLNPSKVLHFPNGMGYDTIKIKTVNDEVFTGNREVNIMLLSNTQNYQCKNGSSLRLTILDEEHPLNPVLGGFTCTAKSKYDGDISRTIETMPVDGDVTVLQFKLNQLITGGDIKDKQVVIVEVNLANKTFNWIIGQEFESGGWDWGKFTLWTTSGTWTWHNDLKKYEGTIVMNADGITVNKIVFNPERGIGAMIGNNFPPTNCYDYFFAGMVWTKK